ncbi:MAG TPA: hypothetical protein VJ508_18730, partial [Saprospiraceae bacterium]|nr:hypothetical protein [Saprospiraceae bacterium]
NYGRVSYTNIAYQVQYKGQDLQMSDKLETNTGVPGIWRVFLLKDAPEPALLIGSQSIYLVTIEKEKAIVKPLFEQGSDFASIQWLDSEEGQPGIYREIYSSDERDKDFELSGGRYLAISHAVVFDTKTFQLYPFNTNNEDVDGYGVSQHKALAFAPDSTQVVYYGSKFDQNDYSITYPALICYDLKAGKAYAVPFEKAATNAFDEFRLETEWVNDYFEWTKNDQGQMRLQLKKLSQPLLKKGIITFERFPGYEYRVYPVKEHMADLLYDYMKSQLSFDTTKVQLTREAFNYKYVIPYQNRTFVIEFGKYCDDATLYEDGQNTPYEENKIIIQKIG